MESVPVAGVMVQKPRHGISWISDARFLFYRLFLTDSLGVFVCFRLFPAFDFCRKKMAALFGAVEAEADRVAGETFSLDIYAASADDLRLAYRDLWELRK